MEVSQNRQPDKKKDETFIIVGVLDESYVLIANGRSRKVEKPKNKKLSILGLLVNTFIQNNFWTVVNRPTKPRQR